MLEPMLNLAAQIPTERRRTFWRAEESRWKLTWDGLEMLTMDACLRPLAWSLGGKLYRQGLNGQLMEIQRHDSEVDKFHYTTPVAIKQRYQLLQLWSERLESSQAAPLLEKLGQRWCDYVMESQARFRQLYRPVSILPPDQYRSLVLQLSEGCPWNRCSFCDLYKDRDFTVKNLEQFQQHCESALEFFGEAINWRRGIFLGDGNSGLLPNRQLVPVLTWLRQRFPSQLCDSTGQLRHPLAFEQVSAFVDTFSGPIRTSAKWRQLQQLGLRQLHLGLESGNPDVLQLLGKPSEGERVVEVVRQIKQAGIAVSVIFMLGVGGQELAAQHLQDTIRLLQSLPLTVQDRVYLSELLVHPHSEYQKKADSLGVTPLSRAQCRQQARVIREAVGPGPIVSLYDVRQFVYH